MRFRRPWKTTLTALRSALIAAAAIAFFLAATGVPLPTGSVKDRSIPFPCMDRACGCHDAAGCKEHCCCFSSEEKLAWAAEHDVDPTPFVDAQALVGAKMASCHRHEAGQEQKAAAACCARKTHRQRVADAPAGSISIAAYRQCTGMAPLWTLLGAALPPPAPVRYEFAWVPAGNVAQPNSDPAIISFSPPTPPPRA